MTDNGKKFQTARERMIEKAQVDAHVERDRVVRSMAVLDGDVPREALLDYQDAILSFFWSLRPLRLEGVVADFWSDCIVSEEWFDGVEAEEVPVVDAELDGGPPMVRTMRRERPAPVRGLSALEDLPHQVERQTETHSSMRGAHSREVVRQRVLDERVLFDIHEKLDDAASMLGFAPDAPLLTADAEVV